MVCSGGVAALALPSFRCFNLGSRDWGEVWKFLKDGEKALLRFSVFDTHTDLLRVDVS
jgi:hypothetical protein